MIILHPSIPEDEIKGNFFLYFLLFTDMNTILRLMLWCLFMSYFAMFNIFLIGPSLVAQEATNSYRVFLKLYIRLNQKRKRKLSIMENIKVRNLYFEPYNFKYQINLIAYRCLITSNIFHQNKFLFLVSICLISTFKRLSTWVLFLFVSFSFFCAIYF